MQTKYDFIIIGGGHLRGWDVVTGLQTESKLRELELSDIVDDLARRGLIAD